MKVLTIAMSLLLIGLVSCKKSGETVEPDKTEQDDPTVSDVEVMNFGARQNNKILVIFEINSFAEKPVEFVGIALSLRKKGEQNFTSWDKNIIRLSEMNAMVGARGLLVPWPSECEELWATSYIQYKDGTTEFGKNIAVQKE